MGVAALGEPTGKEERGVKSKKAVAPVVVLLLLFVLSGCGENVPSMFKPESPGASDIARLAYTIFAILAGVAVTVWVLLAITLVRDRRRRPDDQVEQTAGNTRIEVIWTLIPACIVTVLMLLTLHTTGQLQTNSSDATLTVTGHQWWWEVQYANGSFNTANEIHVPLDKQVTADLFSADVIHTFWIPQMGGKIQMIPGHTRTMVFVPTETGTYQGICGEYCGPQHARMHFYLVVEPVQQFAAWFANQQRLAVKPTGALAVAGSKTITTLPCVGCHTIRGTPMAGVVGPDLTHVGSRMTLAAGALTNTPAHMHAWIEDPQGIKPECLMPTIPLTSQQLDELVAYLQELK
jgi:cytochrome c oxidase subunit II